MSLYQLTQQHQEVLSLVEHGDIEAIDVADTIEALEGEFNQKAISLVKFNQNRDMVAKAKKELAKKLVDEAVSIEKKNQKLIDYLDMQMTKTGITEIACDYFKIRYKKLPDVVEVDDLESLPSEFVKEKTTKTADKVGIKKQLQAGENINGASLVTGRTKLEIK